eukprot:TRINITY_DN5411_c0_g1_i1.p1 TRINITY_DN5411_c0_g1~~TRINITY_DN5411_c0_g1_i1.p1  ORF type:complete len:501 (+),score=61.82 TRINITY_DN5411_c0_g1_i1:189-1505(+)
MLRVFSAIGDVERAEALLHRLEGEQKPDKRFYDMMLRFYSRYQPEKCDLLFHKMQERGFLPDSRTYPQVFASMQVTGPTVEKAESLFRKMVDEGVVPTVRMYAGLLYMYSNERKVEEAELLFCQMVENGIKPDKETYTTMISMYGQENMIDQAESLLAEVIQNRVEIDTITYTTLISMYGRLGEFSKAESLFRQLRGKADSLAYSAMVTIYCKQGLVEEAENTYGEARKQNFAIKDTSRFDMMLMYKNLALVDKAKTFFTDLSQSEKLDTKYYNVMLHLYAFNRRVEEAEALFSKIHQKTVFTYNTMLELHSSYEDRTATLFRNMTEDGIVPNSRTYGILVQIAFKRGDHDRVKTLMREMGERGLSPSDTTYNIALRVYGKEGDIEGAEALFSSIKANQRPSPILYKTMIALLNDADHFQKATALFEEFSQNESFSKE